MTQSPLKHQHRACVACLHKYAHGLYDGFSLAVVELAKVGYPEAIDALDPRQSRAVNRDVRKAGVMLGIDDDALSELMRHHGARP